MDKMCPDKQFLSVYFDKELPSPWKERMEQHLETCSECRANLEVYRKMSGSLSADGEGVEAGAAETAALRVWERLDKRKGCGGRGLRLSPSVRISQALAAAAAGAIAATAVICFMLFLSRGQNIKDSVPELTGASANFSGVVPDDYNLDIQASNMSDVLRYLENDDTNIVIIKLPEQKKFSRYGEPAFINAVDYTRRAKK
ncbi:MAG: hypothetical protein LBD86_01960 [Spirochaetaceae bacterium]|jgi:hypothetical protein|nr:hypothetical protein [Spirochaetaceae bacterium]